MKGREPEQFLTVRQVSERLNISTSMVYSECYGGRLPYSRFGRVLRISESALKRYIDARSYGS